MSSATVEVEPAELEAWRQEIRGWLKANIPAWWREEFAAAARGKGRTETEITAVWDLLMQFRGYAFCRAHSTAYGLEAYEAAQLKRYWPAEFLASVLTHGKGFYSRLFYTIEARRLGISLAGPEVNGEVEKFVAGKTVAPASPPAECGGSTPGTAPLHPPISEKPPRFARAAHPSR